MSNPLASAEARQAAEKIAREVYPGFTTENVEQAAAIIAESYADLVREREELGAGKIELASLLCAAEQRIAKIRHWVENDTIESFKDGLLERKDLDSLLDVIDGKNKVEELKWAEAAINSATPKQGEGNNG